MNEEYIDCDFGFGEEEIDMKAVNAACKGITKSDKEISKEIFDELNAENLDDEDIIQEDDCVSNNNSPKRNAVKKSKRKVKKSKLSCQKLVHMHVIMKDLANKNSDYSNVKRKEIMNNSKDHFELKDIYRELLHPSMKGANRGCYDAEKIIDSLESQITNL